MKHDKNQFEGLSGLRVEVRNGDVTKAMRIFKKKVQDSGILQELKEREYYEKPTTKRKKAKAAAKARWKKKLEKSEIFQVNSSQKNKRK